MATHVTPQRCSTKILNLQSEFSVEELDKVRQRPLKPAVAEIPSGEAAKCSGEAEEWEGWWRIWHPP